MQFNQQQYETAGNADLLEYLKNSGYNIVKSGNGHCLKEHDSLRISNNMWFWHSRGFGGGPIQFLTQYEQRSLPDAVTILVEGQYSEQKPHYESSIEKQRTDFKPPEANKDSRRVFAYLNKTRGIAPDVISELMRRHIVYESKDYHNCVFIGLNENGEPGFAAQRSTYTQSERPFKNDVLGSDKRNPFAIVGKNDCVYAFESAIDAMSYCSIQNINGASWQDDHLIALGGVADVGLMSYLDRNPFIKNVYLCLDNDEAGMTATDSIADKLTDKGYHVFIKPPFSKDYNQDLLSLLKEQHTDCELET